MTRGSASWKRERMDGLLGCRSVDSGCWPRYRYVVSDEPLSASATVCRAPAHVAAVSEEWKRRVCAHCFSVAEARMALCCAACQQCYYCGSECMDAHRAAHARLCPALERWTQLKKAGKDTMTVLRLLLEVLAMEHADVDGTTTAAIPPKTSGADTVSFAALQHHPASYDTPKEASDWAHCCASFRSVLEACSWCPWRKAVGGGDERPPPPRPPPSDAELHALTSRIDSNCFGIFRPDTGDATPPRTQRGRDIDLLGRGVYLQAALFNHSCAPNCSVSAGARTLEVVLDEDVAAGEELCISYIDTQQPRAARQKALRAHYHFTCVCARCAAEGGPGGSAKLSYSSGGGPPKPQRSKRERRERREQKGCGGGEGGGSAAAPLAGASEDVDAASSAAPPAAVTVRVVLDLRVLRKLAKAPSAKDARRRKGSGPPPPTHVAMCQARLRTAAVVEVA